MAAAKTTMPMPSKAVPLSFVSSSEPPPRVHHGSKQPPSTTRPPIAASSRDRPTGRRCIVMTEPASPRPASRLAVDLRLEHADEAEVAIQLAIVEPIADDELVRDGETGVVDVDLDQAPCRLVKQRADPERRRLLAAQVAHQVVEREPRVDDVLDDHH